MTINRIERTTIKIKYFKEDKVFDAYELFVSYEDILNNKTVVQSINVIHESQEKEYFDMLEHIKNAAKKTRNNALWVMYFDYMKYSAEIAYNYALTVHKSQGSTYENVLLMEDDLEYNPKTIEKNRIRYTAYTRASKKLYTVRTQTSLPQTYKDYRTEDYTSTGPT